MLLSRAWANLEFICMLDDVLGKYAEFLHKILCEVGDMLNSVCVVKESFFYG